MLIGVDIGTSTAKAILMREDGAILASHSEAYPIDTPRPGWAEQNPDVWLEKALVCLRAVASGYAAEVKGIAFSGQMHGVVVVDGKGKPLRPAIIWADSRSRDALDEIASVYPSERFCGVVLNRPAAGFGIASLVWLRMHEPEVLEQARYVLCPKDYVRFGLTGEIGQEVSDASATCCMDVRKREWAWDILKGLGLPERIFPTVSESADQAGVLTEAAADKTGLVAGTPVFFGGADNGMAGIGSGLVDEGTMGINIGTGGQCVTCASQPYFDKEYRTSTFCHSITGRWSLFGATLCAGLSMKWLRDTFFPGQDFAVLSDFASRAKPGSGGAFFLPYLTGERTPWLDPAARGIFWGLSLDQGAPEMCRAVMEGVTYALEQSFAILTGAGVKPTRLLSMGGGAKSALWPQIQADVFGMPVETVSGGDACTGAAVIAGVGAGIYRDVFEGVRAAVKAEGRIFTPDPRTHEIYRDKKEIFRQLYLDNKNLFHSTGI